MPLVVAFYLILIAQFCLSVYAWYIHKHPKKHWCDFSKHSSCSKAFKDTAGKTQGIPNPLLGMLFSVALAISTYLQITTLSLFLLGIACTMSVKLLHRLWVTKNACIICILHASLIFTLTIMVWFIHASN
jgi:uncharacterized membrane protein